MLDEIQRRWYVSTEFHKETTTWEELTISFIHTFRFVNDNSFIHRALLDIRDKVLEIVSAVLPIEPQWMLTLEMIMTCYNISGELDDEDDPRAFDIPE